MPTYNLGLDVRKVRTQYCLMDPAGRILDEGNVPTEEVAGFVPAAECAVVLEATNRQAGRVCSCGPRQSALPFATALAQRQHNR